MTVRDATRLDATEIVGLLVDAYAEAPYEAPQVNTQKAAHVIHKLIDSIGDEVFLKVIEIEGLVVGATCAERVTDIWSDAEKVTEHFMYVSRGFRSTISAGRLMLAFSKWAQIRPAVVRVEASMGIDDAHAVRVFNKMGYGPRGTLHGLEAY